MVPSASAHSFRRLMVPLHAVLCLLLIPLGANAQTFSNTSPIAIPGQGIAAPYPSTINVAGRSDPINGVRVTLHGLTHTYPADIGVLLVAPNGARIVLMEGAGSGAPISGIDATFTSGTGDTLGSPINSGTYRPTGGVASYQAPAPAGPYGNSLEVLNGAAANGIWSLYVQDFTSGDSGAIGAGWSLTLLTSEPTSPTSFTYQGRLTGGDASADFRVSLWDHPSSTDPARRIAGPIDRTGVTLDDGLFTLNLDFGVPIPGDRGTFLQIEVASPSGSGFVTLSPRQRITPAPVAGTLPALTTLPASAEIRGPQGDATSGSLTIRATGTTLPSPSGSLGGTLRLIAGNANASAGSAPPVGTSLDNNVQIFAGDNTYSSAFGTVFNGNIQFFAGNGQPERMRLVGDNGFVGIGTTNPVALLDVRGSIALGANGELRAVAGEENLRTIRGTVGLNGAASAGTGFTSSRTGVGIYTVTFTTPFSTFPVITANALNASPVYIHFTTVVANTATINCRNPSGVLTDSGFNFAAVGPR